MSGLEAGEESASGTEAPRGDSADASSHPSVAALRGRFGDAVLHHTIFAGDEHVVYVAPERVRELLQWLRDDDAQRYDMLIDLTAVDYGGGRPLEVVYQLWSTTEKRQLRLKATLPLTALEIDSAVPVWNSADWLEREVWDLFGIHFRGHPDLRRIMMPDNYAEGHPLRKDFPLRGRFSRAEQTRRSLEMAVEDFYTPDELTVAGGVVPVAATRARASGDATADDKAKGAPGAPDRPNDPESWTPGASGSAAGGAPGPEGASS
ncbi:MAG: NADH-quinone oxidoreductase subunit C [Gemmatimonadetes bacterium]|nr:NADH-quinone oxidoreductase subunit C [Gemmatimonadota bacterium]